MAAAVLRAQLGRAGIWASIKNPLTLSFCSLSASLTPARFEKNGWEFSENHCDSDFDRLRDSGLRLPQYYNNTTEFCIKHLDSGIKLSFSAYDALCKWLLEKKTRNPLECDFPSYGSPLLPHVGHGYDSAYVGRVFVEKPGEEPQKIIPKWEDIDWKNLNEQFDWTIKNDLLSGGSRSLCYLNSEERLTIFHSKENDIKNNNKIVFNLEGHLYRDSCGFCYLSLVVTDYGWFIYLQQCLGKNDKTLRVRHMTMHCDHEEAIIYREIVEQSKAADLVSLDRATLWPHFHEVKKFKIQGAYMEESSSCTVDDAKRYTVFTIDEWKEGCHKVPEISSPKIKSLFANCGKELRSVEEKTNTRIQIFPLFQNPCYYLMRLGRSRIAEVRTSAYVQCLDDDLSGLDYIDDLFKCC